MKQSEDLFLLIKSLEKNERRYFKLFTSLQKGEKIYNTLFDAMDRQKVYDEASLLKRLKKTPRQFSAIKDYLYSLILKSLRNYEQNQSVDAEIREMLNDAEILFKKGLHPQCSGILFKAKKIAQRYDKYPALLDIFNAERQLAYFFSEKKNYAQTLQEIPDETFSVLDKVVNITQSLRVYAGIFSFWEKGKPRTPASMKEIKQLHASAQLKKNSQYETFESTWQFYIIQQYYYRLTLQYQKAYVFGKKAIKHLESSPEKLDDGLPRYFITLHTFMAINIGLGKYQESLNIIRKISKLMERPGIRPYKGLLAKIYSTTYLTEMLLHVDYGEFEKGYLLISKTEDGLKKFDRLLSPFDKISIYYGLSYIYFCTKEYKNALKWLNKILDEPTPRPDIYFFARVQNLILHFELDNLYVLNSMIRSTYGFLYKHKALYKSEKAILLHLKKLINAGKKEQIRIFTDLKNTLSEILQDSHEKILLDYIDILAWLDSKIQQRPFADILKEKNASIKRIISKLT